MFRAERRDKPRPPRPPALPLCVSLLPCLRASQVQPAPVVLSGWPLLCEGLPCERPAATTTGSWRPKSCGPWSVSTGATRWLLSSGSGMWDTPEGGCEETRFPTPRLCPGGTSGASPQFLVWTREFWALRCLLLRFSPQVVLSGWLLRLAPVT